MTFNELQNTKKCLRINWKIKIYTASIQRSLTYRAKIISQNS